MQLIFVSTLLTLCLLWDPARADPASQPVRPQITLFGDSITEYSFSRKLQGWGGILAERYARSTDILNRGFSGYNTRWALTLMKEAIRRGDDAFTSSLAVVFFGANDATPAPDNLHVPLQEYTDNIISIIKTFRSKGKPSMPLILITPPPSKTKKRDSSITALYAQAIRDIGSKTGVPVLDLWPPAALGLDKDQDLQDGLHLSITGNAKVAEGVWGIIKKSYPQVLPKMYYATPRQIFQSPNATVQAETIKTWTYHPSQ